MTVFAMHRPKTCRQVLRDNVGRVNAYQTVYLRQSKCGGRLRKALCNRWICRR